MSSNLERESHTQVGDLSRQEQEIIEHLTNGDSVRSIAADIGIDLLEAEHLIRQIMAKLSVTRTADLVRLGLESRLAQRL